MARKLWVPRLAICLGFDGSFNNDWTAIRAETIDGYQFTPTYGPDSTPTFWNPTEHGGKIPRDQVKTALDELFGMNAVERFYCDPHDWQSEIGAWAVEFGEEHVFEWDTGRGQSRVGPVHSALERMLVDMQTGAISHDGCPVTSIHMGNAIKMPKPGQRYVLAKATEHQKIDLAMASVLAHEAACDARDAGWAPEEPPSPMIVRR